MSAAIDRFLSGASDAGTLAELRSSVTRWMLDDTGPDLHRALGLGTRRAARLSRRDALLREAATLLPGSAWERSRALSEACRIFERRRWPRWRFTGAPDTAGQLDQLLYEARRLDRIDLSPRQLFNVLAGGEFEG